MGVVVRLCEDAIKTSTMGTLETYQWQLVKGLPWLTKSTFKKNVIYKIPIVWEITIFKLLLDDHYKLFQHVSQNKIPKPTTLRK